MSSTHELWGQIGATFYLTPEEAGALLALNSKMEPLFTSLVREHRYKVNDQFYAPIFELTDDKSTHMDKDIFINLNTTKWQDHVYSDVISHECLQKVLCQMGVVLYLDDSQLQCLRRQDGAAADLVFDLINTGQYHVLGGFLFEDGIEREGFISPKSPLHIGLPLCKQYRDNPMLNLACKIRALTDGLCGVGPGPYGFGVHTDRSSKIGIVLTPMPDVVKDNILFPDEIKSYEYMVKGCWMEDNKIATPEEIEAVALDSGDPISQRITLALRELSKETVQINSAECQDAFEVMLAQEMPCVEEISHDKGPAMSM